MDRTRNALIAGVTATLLAGCQPNMEMPDTAGSNGRVIDSINSTGSTSTSSTPAQTMPAVAVASMSAGDAESKSSKSYAEKLGQDAVVDWTKCVVTARGIGFAPRETLNLTQARLLAKRAALAVAYRNLLEATQAIRVDSTTTVKNYFETDDVIVTRITGMVEKAEIIDERELEKNGYEVVVQMKMTGEMSRLFSPKDAPPPTRILPDRAPAAPPVKSSAYTGLVVDARGMDVQPALMPRIVTEDGQEAYSQSYVLAKYRQKEGIAAYVSDPVSAETHPKVTAHPLLVKALRPAGNSHTDLVISNAAAQTIHGVEDHFRFLEKAQVIVIIDRSEKNAPMR